MKLREMPANVRNFWILMFVLLITIAPAILLGAMSKSKAYTEAHKIWGDYSHIQQGITWAEPYDTYQIGFMSTGCKDSFTVVGTGVNSWDAAFDSLPPDKGIKGTYGGLHDMVAETPPPSDLTHEVVSVPAPGTIVGVQFMLDGKNLGPAVPVVNSAGTVPTWKAVFVWDTKTVSNGLHYTCAELIHSDGYPQKTPAAMIKVQNP